MEDVAECLVLNTEGEAEGRKQSNAEGRHYLHPSQNIIRALKLSRKVGRVSWQRRWKQCGHKFLSEPLKSYFINVVGGFHNMHTVSLLG